MYSQYKCDKFYELHFGRIDYMIRDTTVEIFISNNCGDIDIPIIIALTLPEAVLQAHCTFWFEMAKLTYTKKKSD